MTSETVAYDAYLEALPDGAFRALILDLPGCAVTATSEALALEKIVASLPSYFEWLRSHDDYTPIVSGPFSARIVSRQQVAPSADRVVAATFDAELEPLTRDERDIMVSLMEWAFADVMAAIRAKSQAAESSLGPAVAEFANQQSWLAARFGLSFANSSDGADPSNPGKTSTQLFLAMPDDDLARVVRTEGGQWSLRKVMNRGIVCARELMARLSDEAE